MPSITLSVLQNGMSSALVVLFFPSAIGALKQKLKKALGPLPTILIDETAKGTDTLDALMQVARSVTGIDDLWLACLGGFSAGCQRVRALCLAGAESKSYLFIDGAHASAPPADWQIKYLKDLVERAEHQEITVVITHTYIQPSNYTSTADVARLVTGWKLPIPEPPNGVRKWDQGRLFVYSYYSGPQDPKAHSAQAMVALPMVLDARVRPLVEPGYQPDEPPAPNQPTAPTRKPGKAPVPERVFTADDGWMNIEDEYLPRVVTRENGNAPPAALEAQAIAARTYLLRAMLDDPKLGTEAKPVPNSDRTFQTYATKATARCIEATKATAGIVATYSHELITANFAAGALRTPDGGIGKDPTHTEHCITYNEGKTGTFVKPTTQARLDRWQNRGSMGQNCAAWLARHGYDREKILRYFYGLDLELTDLRGAVPTTSKGKPTPRTPRPERTPRPAQSGGDGDDSGAWLAIAGAGLAWVLSR